VSRQPWSSAALVLCLCIAQGCSSSGPPVAQSDVADRFAPATLRIHPISHVHIRQDGIAVVEAAVRLQDADGFPVRGTGQLEFEFHQGDRHGEAIMSRIEWSADLNDAATNAEIFDSTTRTYLVPLTLKPGTVPRSPQLVATLYQSAGKPLRDSLELSVLRAAPADEQNESATP
jgi:hypothetical protein